MKPTICTDCQHSALVALDATVPDGLTVVEEGKALLVERLCVAVETRCDPVTGDARPPRPCREINLVASCPWFVPREGDLRTGDLLIPRGEVAVFRDVPASRAEVIPLSVRGVR